MQTIKLMADYGCWPLWEQSPGRVGNIDPADLPLSEDLRDRLDAWADIYDSILKQEDPIKSGFASPAAEQRFVEQGKALGAELQAELGDAYQVFVHIP